MRINKFVAAATGMSRRAADTAIQEHRVSISGHSAETGQIVKDDYVVTLDGKQIEIPEATTVMLNKPRNYVCSRQGQGSATVYDLLPPNLHHLKPVGRLDKESSGLLLLTNDGYLANQLTHPRYTKTKIYDITLNKPLADSDRSIISQKGVKLDDGISKLKLERLDNPGLKWKVTMQQGRNRQIRRTFAFLGYNVTRLHRTHFGPYSVETVAMGEFKIL